VPRLEGGLDLLQDPAEIPGRGDDHGRGPGLGAQGEAEAEGDGEKGAAFHGVSCGGCRCILTHTSGFRAETDEWGEYASF